MSHYDVFTGLPNEVDEARARRWGSVLAKSVFAILVVGVVLAAILWPTTNADVGALTLAATFAACAGLLVLRQALLAERR